MIIIYIKTTDIFSKYFPEYKHEECDLIRNTGGTALSFKTDSLLFAFQQFCLFIPGKV